jgi:hypothetical protein
MYVSHDGNTWTEIDSRDNEGANYTLNSARKFDAPTYTGYYEWIKIVFDNQNNYWFSQTDWRFDGTYMDYAPAAGMPAYTIDLIPNGTSLEVARGTALSGGRYENFTPSGVVVDTTTFKTGSQSLYFNSTSSYLALGLNDFLSTHESWSVSFWFQATSTGSHDSLMYFQFGSESYRMIIKLENTADPLRFISIASGAVKMDQYVNIGTYVGTWLHMAFVHEVDGTTTTTRGYLNGVLKATGSFSNSGIGVLSFDSDSEYTLSSSSLYQFVIGNRVGQSVGRPSYFDDIRLHQIALTDAMVQELYASTV